VDSFGSVFVFVGAKTREGRRSQGGEGGGGGDREREREGERKRKREREREREGERVREGTRVCEQASLQASNRTATFTHK